MRYVSFVNPVASSSKRHGFDIALVLIWVQGIYEIAAREFEPQGPLTSSWWGYLAVSVMVAPLFARRRFPFTAPIAIWVLGPGLSFIDGGLISSAFSIYVVGAAAAYLLGNLGDANRSRLGLAIILIGSAIVVSNQPASSAPDFVTIPATFAIA